MSLLQEIEDGASDDSMPLVTLLRKCLILASRLNSRPASDWIDWELNGYPIDVTVPEYRLVPLILKANMHSIGWKAEGWVVPPALLGKNADAWTNLPNRDSIGSLEHSLGKAESTVCYSMGNLSLFLQSKKFTEMEITSAWGECSSSRLAHILETVRTRVLKFALELGREYPDAGMERFPAPKVEERATQLFVANIYGNANVVGTASHSNFVLNISKGDFVSLKQLLQQKGVEEADIKELRAALKAEPEAVTTGFGPRVAAWCGKMMKKAAEGTWTVSTAVAGDLIGKALAAYNGLS